MKLATVGGNRWIAVLSGLFILLGVGVLLGWLYLQVVKPGQRARYFIFMENVAGVRPGAEVRVNGFAIGQVDEIRPDLDIDRIEFRVDIVIDKIWAIPVDSTITVATDGILATPILELTPGVTETLLEEGSRILTVPPPPSMTEQVSNLIEKQVTPALKAFLVTVETLQKQLEESVPAIVSDAHNIMTKASNAISAIEVEVQSLAVGLGDAGDMLSRISQPQNVKQIEDLLANLDVTSRNLRSASEDLQAVLTSSQSLVQRSDRILAENEDALINTIKDTELTMQSAAASMSVVMQNLERASQEIAALAGKINDNPGVILSGSKPGRDPFK